MCVPAQGVAQARQLNKVIGISGKAINRKMSKAHQLAGSKQTGAVLLEFSFIVVAILTLFYGIIVYSIVFVTQQAVVYAAETGADAVVTVAPDAPNYDQLAQGAAAVRANFVLNFLPGSASVCLRGQNAPGSCSNTCFVTVNGARQCIVEVNYNFSNWGFLVTGLLPLPDNIRGSAVVNAQLPTT